MALDDQDLVRRVQRGEAHAFRMLVERYHTKIYHLCYRLLQQHEEARDATQETFLKAYGSINEFRQTCRWQTWLTRIATNECLNRLRKRGRNPNWVALDDLPPEELALHLTATAPSPLEAVERKEVQQMIHRAIEALPLPYRLAVTLYHLDGLSYDEIAQVMDAPVGTVKSYLFRGRALLRTKLVRYLHAESAPLPGGPNEMS